MVKLSFVLIEILIVALLTVGTSWDNNTARNGDGSGGTRVVTSLTAIESD